MEVEKSFLTLYIIQLDKQQPRPAYLASIDSEGTDNQDSNFISSSHHSWNILNLFVRSTPIRLPVLVFK